MGDWVREMGEEIIYKNQLSITTLFEYILFSLVPWDFNSVPKCSNKNIFNIDSIIKEILDYYRKNKKWAKVKSVNQLWIIYPIRTLSVV